VPLFQGLACFSFQHPQPWIDSTGRIAEMRLLSDVLVGDYLRWATKSTVVEAA
jgi:hypothetical protein